VLRGEQHTARVIWRPRKPGKLRETLHFKLDGKWPLQVVVTGEALAAGAAGRRGSVRGRSTASSSRAAPLQLYGYGGDPTDAAATAILGKRRALSPDGKENAAADAAARRAHMLKWSAEATKGLRLSATSVNTAANTSSSVNSSKNQLDASGEAEGGAQQPARKKAKGLAGSSVNTSSSGSGISGSSSAKTALLRKSLHDKRWAEKQAESFTAWLNFALLPKAEWGGSSDNSDTPPSTTMNSTNNTGNNSVSNSSSSAVSQSMFSKVRAARGEARARQRAMLLYRSPELSGMRAAVADKVCIHAYTQSIFTYPYFVVHSVCSFMITSPCTVLSLALIDVRT
jgi:hypothetical protein